ncbi:hypothetical protein BDV95DRAFT_610949 [Massariosphaeria phaeospora]|uniref:Uncharacterized protein n=1 Tax=Massariosphaeria phaeospora TaxID=100035 RepID=A0A7C8I1U7_9PLEO|nr:hypothetical protein BDV95DRAFT_610949 [Massariosphaeria phaeospora]
MDVSTFFELLHMKAHPAFSHYKEVFEHHPRASTSTLEAASEEFWQDEETWTAWHFVHSLANGLSFATTESGLLGIVPPLTQPGDIVCVLDGFSLPVVLRKNDDHYVLVGACRVPQILDSLKGTVDIPEMLRDGRFTMEDFQEIQIR